MNVHCKMIYFNNILHFRRQLLMLSEQNISK